MTLPFDCWTEHIISKIDKQSSKGIGTKYNGIDVLQTCDYIKLHCESYIDKVLLSHGWSQPSPSVSAHHDIIPLSLDTVSCLHDLIGPPEHTKEHTEVEESTKFSYCSLLGELLYSFIVIHVKIRNAIQFLSKFSSSPHLDHYMALKSICKYLQKHKLQGLIYWHTKAVNFLPVVPFKVICADPQLQLSQSMSQQT